jgi:hypothetical protein
MDDAGFCCHVVLLARTEVILASWPFNTTTNGWFPNRQPAQRSSHFQSRGIRTTIDAPRSETRRPRSPALATVGKRPSQALAWNRSAGGIVRSAMTRLRLLRTLIASCVIAALVIGCAGPASTPTGPPDTGIRGAVTAGPVCPVERNPPDPSCAPRPVAGAAIVIRDGSGAQVAVAISGADGAYAVSLAPGDYVVDPQPVSGLMGTAPKRAAAVTAGTYTDVPLDYDTGIR